MQDIAMWSAGATYCAQGTVAEDATAGTHVCTMTVTPGAGNEMQVLYGRILEGNTATAQQSFFAIDDGTNLLVRQVFTGDTAANTEHSFMVADRSTTNSTLSAGIMQSMLTVSGTMRLVLSVSTAAVSVTQTFAVVCRTRGGKPSTVLADTVGAPVLTLNTDKLF